MLPSRTKRSSADCASTRWRKRPTKRLAADFSGRRLVGYMDETIRNNTGRTPKLATMVFDRGKGMIATEED